MYDCRVTDIPFSRIHWSSRESPGPSPTGTMVIVWTPLARHAKALESWMPELAAPQIWAVLWSRDGLRDDSPCAELPAIANRFGTDELRHLQPRCCVAPQSHACRRI